MAEYINRFDLINRIYQYAANHRIKYDPQTEEIFRAIIESIPTADVQPVKWIPATERLPNQEGDVLICYEWVGESGTKYKEMDIMTLKEVDYRGHKIIAWMPLPEPPKEDET